VEAFDSGVLENAIVEELFRRAKCVVFPSFYEGFGLPLLNGLAHGKTVVVRRSSVFHEVIARFPNPGRLVEFENSLELVPILGKVLHGAAEALPHLAGAMPRGPAHDWKACASQLLEFADKMRAAENVEIWRKRDRALGYVKAGRR
jgi:glycosyltransferase involved in cell wall biosynthesis